MSLLASAGSRLGFAVAQRVYCAWMGRDGNVEPDQLFKEHGFFDRDARRARRQYEEMGEAFTERLEPFLEVEYGGVPENERTAAFDAVTDSLRTSRLAANDLMASNLDAEQVYAVVRSQSSGVLAAAALSSGGEVIYDRILREACDHLIEMTAALPTFERRVFSELLSRESALRDLIHGVMDRLPQAPHSLETADDIFEQRYRKTVINVLDRLQLFGLNVDPSSRRYPLTVAYISLAAVLGQGLKQANDERPVDDALPEENQLNSSSAEALLASEQYLLVFGDAGSGKTTLLQWLAVNCARRSLPEGMSHFANTVPFFVQLRRYVDEGLPAPEDFPKYSASNAFGQMPSGFVHRTIEAKRALLLIDGLDELPEDQRPATSEWIESLATDFPHLRIVVTSRPGALTEDVRLPGQFVQAELQPMQPADINSFIEHWYDAAKGEQDDDDTINELDRFAESLKRSVKSVPSVRTLATLPLLCAMLCALNRDRGTQLPQNRMDLYRIALETLLDRRDRERQVSTNIRELTFAEKQSILQDLAFWLIRNGQSDSTFHEVVERVQRKLPYLPHVNDSPRDVFRHLMLRSGLLREPIEGRVDFIHRTFQEYLAAKEAVEGNELPLLLQNAHRAEWRETVILASGHGSRQQRSLLIEGLLRQGQEDEANRHALHLLAVACLETATEIEPDLRRTLTRTLRSLVPPRSISEAKSVASAGELAVSNLRGWGGALAVETAACVRALSLIGSGSALDAISTYGRDRRQTVQRELLRAWPLFNPDEYVDQVLSKTPFGLRTVDITDASIVKSSSRLKGNVRLNGDFGSRHVRAEDIESVSRFARISLIGNSSLTDLKCLLPSSDVLQYLDLEASQIRDFTALSAFSQVTFLDVSRTRFHDMRLLSGMRKLDTLYMHGLSQLQSLRGAESLENLRALKLSAAPLREIAPLESCDSFVDLSLSGLSLAALFSLANLGRLSDLELRDVEYTGPVSLATFSRLRGFNMARCNFDPEVYSGLLWSAPKLKDLSISSGRVDVLSLDGCPVLERVSVTSAKSVSRIVGLPNSLRRLTLIGVPSLEKIDGDLDGANVLLFLDSHVPVPVVVNLLRRLGGATVMAPNSLVEQLLGQVDEGRVAFRPR